MLKIHNRPSFVRITVNPLPVYLLALFIWAFFSSLLLWEFVHDKTYKFGGETSQPDVNMHKGCFNKTKEHRPLAKIIRLRVNFVLKLYVRFF